MHEHETDGRVRLISRRRLFEEKLCESAPTRSRAKRLERRGVLPPPVYIGQSCFYPEADADRRLRAHIEAQQQQKQANDR